jgi:hypothetical protein
VGRIFKFGCLGVIGLVAVFVVLAVVTAKPAPQQIVNGQPSQMAQVGQTASKGGWEVMVKGYGPWAQYVNRNPSTPPQGKLMVVDFNAKNLQDKTSNFTDSDFTVEAADKRKFRPANQGASIDKGFVISQTVQPGLATENRVVFDLDPSARDLTLHVLGMDFKLPDTP